MRRLLHAALTLGLAACASAAPNEPAPAALTAENFRSRLTPVGFVIREPGWHVWCCAPVRDDRGAYHAFVSRWPESATFDPGWHTCSEIAYYRAAKPEGPYTFVRTILKGDGRPGSWRSTYIHNPNVVRLPDGRYALVFIGNCRTTGARYNETQKIGLLLADDPGGEWRLGGRDGLIFERPEDPAIWSHTSRCGTSNPTLTVAPDGRFLLYYKSLPPGAGPVRCRMGVAIAKAVEGPYVPEPRPLAENEGNIEDGFAFRLGDEIALLVTDCKPGPGFGGGMIYRSKDGVHFDPKPIRAFESVDKYLGKWPAPKHLHAPWVLQRPALLLGPDGAPTHLTVPCGTAPAGDTTTAVFMFRLCPPTGK